jgi:hypothetical protein
MKGPSAVEVRDRARTLTLRFAKDPVLPLLGWTKAVEQIVTTGPYLWRWTAYAGAVTVLWVAGVLVWDYVEDAADDVTDAVEDTVNGDGGGGA